MEKYESPIKKELGVRIENVSFQMLIVDTVWSVKEIYKSKKDLHNHEFHELFVCGKGEISIKFPAGDITLKSGDIAVIPPGKSHVLHYSKNDTEGYAIPFLCKRINDDTCEDLYKKLLSVAGNKAFICKEHPDFYKRVNKVMEEVVMGDERRFLASLQLFELIFELTGYEKEPVQIHSDADENNFVSGDIRRMMMLDSMIAERYTEKCCAYSMAKELFISTRQLDRIAVKRYGKTLHKVIMDKRFELSKELLTSTNLTVEEVATKSGFSSIASLYREFRIRYGSTPAVFRLQNK